MDELTRVKQALAQERRVNAALEQNVKHLNLTCALLNLGCRKHDETKAALAKATRGRDAAFTQYMDNSQVYPDDYLLYHRLMELMAEGHPYRKAVRLLSAHLAPQLGKTVKTVQRRLNKKFPPNKQPWCEPDPDPESQLGWEKVVK